MRLLSLWPNQRCPLSCRERRASPADNDPNQGRQYLRDTFGQTYWGRREAMVRLLDWLAALGNSEDTADWAKDSEAARILAGRLRNDDA